MYALNRAVRRTRKLFRILGRAAYWPALKLQVFPATEHEYLFRSLSFETIIDVGANVGQFSVVAASLAPRAVIHSFEPIRDCFSKLQAVARVYPTIRPYCYAIGSNAGASEINVSVYRGSSSLLEFTDAQERIYPGTTTSSKESINVTTLSDLAGGLRLQGRTLLKLDIQGFELEALRGAESVLSQISHIYLEASFIELYKQQALAGEIVTWLGERGFRLRGVENVDTGTNLLPVQADFLFERARL